MKLTLWFLLGNVEPENLDPLFCFDSREGESGVVPLNVIFLFFFELKKNHMQNSVVLVGLMAVVTEPWIEKKLKVRGLNWHNWKLENWNKKNVKVRG